MRGRAGNLARDLADPGLVGIVTILISAVALLVSLQANKGLPFVPTYDIEAEVPDAAQLVVNADVRIGGARVGRVTDIEAVQGPKGRPAFARLELAMEADRRLPVDTTVTVRPLSILGAKYVALTPGRSRREIFSGGTIPLRQATRRTELFEAFNVFDAETSRGLRRSITALGDALAGRGTSLNRTVGSARVLMPPLQRVTRVLAEPRTDLDGLVRSAARFTRALAPVSPQLGSLIEGGATTLEAIDAAGDSLGLAIDQLAPTEVVGTSALRRATPVLADAAEITRAIRPGTRLLPAASNRLADALDETTPVLQRTPAVLDPLRTLLAALEVTASEAASSGALDRLFSTVNSLGETLRVLTPAQVNCNVGGHWGRNVPSTVEEGDTDGSWLRMSLLLIPSQMLQSAQPAPDLHHNPYPNQNENECEAGNEPFLPGQQIGNPPGNQPTTTEPTAPPPGVRELAEQSGVIPPAQGGRR